MKHILRFALRLGFCSFALATAPALATDLREAFQRPDTIPFPEDRPYSPLRAALGKMLYFDPRLSGAQNMSCASCHNPSFGWEAPTERPIGAQNTMLDRQAPTTLNLAWSRHFFWDGRAPSLEEQARGPITAEAEMNARIEDVVARLRSIETYATAFDSAFPGQGLTEDTLLTAIATYERTIVSGPTPFDRWVEGDEDAISDSAKRGFDLFVGSARCAACHSGWNFTDDLFHDIGLPDDDLGRGAVTPDDPAARHAFKTPGLRDIKNRAPYMHDGSLPSLESVVLHYSGGGVPRPSLSPLMEPLFLSREETDDLVAFLETVTAEEDETSTPVLPVD